MSEGPKAEKAEFQVSFADTISLDMVCLVVYDGTHESRPQI